MKIKLKILEHGKGLEIPKKETEHSVCVDLRAAISKPIRILNHGGVELIPTGFKMEIPVGYEALIRPRSGLALKKTIGILNSPGTIDSDYRGEVGIILVNHGSDLFTVERGDRIAQMAIRKVEDFEFEVVDELSDTERGEGGYSSTGVK